MKNILKIQIFLLFAWVILSGIAFGQVPRLINYQGVLIDPATDQPATDGTYTIVFSIYNVASGESAIWTESQNIVTKDGLYSVLLGSKTTLTSAILSGPEKYLGIKVGNDPEMTPRKRIVSVAYAILSGGLTLPYSGNVSSLDTAFSITNTDFGTGIYGQGGETGVFGRGFTGADFAGDVGVISSGCEGAGVVGGSFLGDGVVGTSDEYNGVSGLSSNSDWGIGVYGRCPNYAGLFDGDVYVTGSIQKSGGGFIIDHPLDPANKYLYHSFVESPDMKNVYDGVAILDANGEATVELPDWFEALNKDFRYQLTCIGGFAPVYIAGEISEDCFRIAGGRPGMKVCWQITGIRQDAFANTHPIQVEKEKNDIEQGKYLHPKEHGMPETHGIEYERIKRLEKIQKRMDERYKKMK